MKEPRILLAEKSSFSPQGIEALRAIGPVQASDLSSAELRTEIPGYQVLVVRLGVRVDRAVFEAAPELKVVATATTGTDHIDLQAAEAYGVRVLSLKGERAFLDQVFATAEHTFALLLSLIRRLPAAHASAMAYDWRRDHLRGSELNGKVLGIIGCGRLGSMVARYALAFGMRVLVFDPYQSELPTGVELQSSLAGLLGESDIVSLHVPLNSETQGMFGQQEFSRLKPGTFLVNTARGAVVDEAALLAALQSGRLAGAALDVLIDEHKLETSKAHPLIEYARTHSNLLITPHIAGATYESVEKADLFLANKLRELLTNNAI